MVGFTIIAILICCSAYALYLRGFNELSLKWIAITIAVIFGTYLIITTLGVKDLSEIEIDSATVTVMQSAISKIVNSDEITSESTIEEIKQLTEERYKLSASEHLLLKTLEFGKPQTEEYVAIQNDKDMELMIKITNN